MEFYFEYSIIIMITLTKECIVTCDPSMLQTFFGRHPLFGIPTKASFNEINKDNIVAF
jgi:hypothetical protein